MQRPKFEDYKELMSNQDKYIMYSEALDKYIDELESDRMVHKLLISDLRKENNELKARIYNQNLMIEIYEKARDKACERLEEISECAINADYDELLHLTSIYGMHVNRNEWKDWCFEDE